ncbi:MAG: hypothetical protein JSU74_13460 [Candidatus Zixiibacteriota bacterium]|nr:MAG: hypothetical protein JSU74_13460 [candidate division Zixibacteria bacterium]
MTHYVVIFKDGAAYKIAGGRPHVNKGDTVRFFNLADYDADVTFDRAKLPGGNFKLKAKGKAVSKTKVQPGFYPYTVKLGKKEAKASKPIAIVYP